MRPDLAKALAALDENDVTVASVLGIERDLRARAVCRDARELFAKRGADDPDALRDAADEVEAVLGASLSSVGLDAVASAHARAGNEESALAFRLRAVERAPRWDTFECPRVLRALADDLVRTGHREDALDVANRALRYDPTSPRLRATVTTLGGTPPTGLDDLAPLSDEDLVRLLLAEDFGGALADHFAKPRRFALACVRRGDAAAARLPLHATRKWTLYMSQFGADFDLSGSEQEERGWNAALLDRVLATAGGQESLKMSRKRTDNRFIDNYNCRIRACRAVADQPDEVRRYLHDWDRPVRLFTAAILMDQGDAMAQAYIEQSSALGAELGTPGSPSSDDWAMPDKILARRGGDLAVTWKFLEGQASTSPTTHAS